MKIKRLGAAVLAMILILALFAGCGSSGGKKEEGPDTAFLMGSWFARTASKDGVTVDAEDVFNGTFHLYFSKNGECTMAIDQQRAIVKWELTDNGVTLTGDDTYPATFTDDTRTSMVIVVQGIDVLMEKYEE